MLFNLDFANNNILSGFFFFPLIVNLYFLVSAVITQIFNPIADLLIPTGMSKEKMEIEEMKAKEEMEIHLVTVEIKIISKCSI